MRPKTRHRLLILLVIALAVSGMATGAYLFRERQIRHQLNVDREQGLEAYRSRDFVDAIAKLTPYVRHRPDDAEAIFALAIAHVKKPAPDREDVADAVAYLRRYHDLSPSNLDSQHRLLELLRQTRQWDQATELAREILSSDPKDPAAMGALAFGLEVSGQFEAALAAAKAYNDVVPTDLDGHRLTYEVMRALKTPLKEMLGRAGNFEAKYPNDPRFKLAEVIAYSIGKEAGAGGAKINQLEDQELKTLQSATAGTPPDAQFVRHAVRLLDLIRRYDQSLELLSRSSALFNDDPSLGVMYVQRLWESKQPDKVVAALADEPLASGDAARLGYKALALRDLNRQAEADAILAALADRSDDPEAIGWSEGLRAEAVTDLRKRLDGLNEAAIADPGNGVIHFFLAQAYRSAGEEDLALEQARLAADATPSWTAPHLMLAEILTRRGNYTGAAGEADHALAAAKAAGNRYGIDPAFTKALVWFDYARRRNDAKLLSDLLSQLETLRQTYPDETRTLPMYATLLSLTGQADKAKAVIADALALPAKENGQALLLDLANVSSDAHIALEKQLLDAAESKYGRTPRLAFERAKALVYADGRPVSEALAYLKESASHGKGEAWEWGMYTCRFLEDARDASAGSAWVTVGNGYPNNLTVQNAILDPTIAVSAWAGAAGGERTFIATTIDRVHQLLGDSALSWKLAKARWLLAAAESKDPAQDKANANDASVLLADVLRHATAAERAEPHILQAQAMEKLDNHGGAAGKMAQAWVLSPGDAQIGYDLLRLYHAAGRFAEAADTFDRLTNLPLSSDMAQKSAAILFDQHDLTRSATLLRRYDDPNHPSSNLIGLLAMIDQRSGLVKEAGDLFLRLQDATDVPPIVCSSAADFFASVGDRARAGQFLQKLNGAGLSLSEQKLKLAAYQERYGTDQAAVDQLYLDAIAGDPNNPDPIIRHVGYLIRRQRFGDAQSAADAAIKRWPDSIELQTLKSLAATLTDPAHGEELAPVAADLSVEPGNPAVGELLAAMNQPTSADSSSLLDLIKKYPEFYPTYEIAVRRGMSGGKSNARETAVELASAAMDKFPDQLAAARLACVACSELGHWSQALAAGEEWRQRAFQQPVDADWHIALCLINLDRAPEAVNRLGTYVFDAKAHPDEPLNRQILRTYAAALIAAGRVDDAQALLNPLTSQSAAWRATWMDLARESFRDSDAAAIWLQKVIPLIPVNAIDERVGLARAWFDLAIRHGYQKGLANCTEILRPLADANQIDTGALLTLGMAEDQAHDPKAAADYRHILATAGPPPAAAANTSPSTRPVDSASIAAAANNLANLLLNQGDPTSIAEAQSLATQAIAAGAAYPVRAYYYDTLARIYLRQGKLNAAAAQFASADTIHPNDPAILIGWADALARAGKTDEAVMKVQTMQTQIPSGAKLPPTIQEELDSVKRLISKAMTATN